MSAEPHPAADELRVATVNLAHGRGTGAHQLLTRRETLRANLEGIGRWLAHSAADVACLQEADACSWWSGRFDHVAAVAKVSGHRHFSHAHNVRQAGLYYGTALLSKLPLHDARAHSFEPTPPTFRKGFAMAGMRWPGDPDFEFDLVSLHTDFARASKRKSQVRELVQVARQRGRPLIVAGDFNSDWRERGAAQLAARELGLQAHDPNGPMITFPTTRARLDWVLVSREFELVDVQTREWDLSDHRPLLARVRRR